MRFVTLQALSRHGFRSSFSLIALASILGAKGEVVYDNGSPDHTQGSEMTSRVQADDFTLTAATRVEGVQFSEFELPSWYLGSFVWQIYANDPAENTPGALLASGTAVNMSRVATGFTPLGAFQEFVINFEIPPISLPAGKYWMALHNGPLNFSDFNARVLYWEATSRNGTPASCERLPPFNGIWYSKEISNWPELSFRMIGAPEPRIISLSYSAKQLSFTTIANRNYRVEYKNEISDASWTPVPGAEAVAGTGGVVQVVDNSAGARPRRYYHVLML